MDPGSCPQLAAQHSRSNAYCTMLSTKSAERVRKIRGGLYRIRREALPFALADKLFGCRFTAYEHYDNDEPGQDCQMTRYPSASSDLRCLAGLCLTTRSTKIRDLAQQVEPERCPKTNSSGSNNPPQQGLEPIQNATGGSIPTDRERL